MLFKTVHVVVAHIVDVQSQCAQERVGTGQSREALQTLLHQRAQIAVRREQAAEAKCHVRAVQNVHELILCHSRGVAGSFRRGHDRCGRRGRGSGDDIEAARVRIAGLAGDGVAVLVHGQVVVGTQNVRSHSEVVLPGRRLGVEVHAERAVRASCQRDAHVVHKVRVRVVVVAAGRCREADQWRVESRVERHVAKHVAFRGRVAGHLSQEDVQESVGQCDAQCVVICDDNGQTVIRDNDTPAEFALPVKAELVVEDGKVVHAGDILAKIPRELAKNKDITGGLPRVAELFEARIPKDQGIISEIDGIVEFDTDIKKKQRIRIRPEDEKGEVKEYLIPRGRHVTVHMGEYVRAGDPLIDGSANPHDILAVKGTKALQKYLVDEIQQVYRLQGVGINDKHIEVIVRQMLRQVSVEDPGDSSFLIGQEVMKTVFDQVNRQLLTEGRNPARSKPKLLGITKASLSTDSFISAASFQETTKVLTDAALGGKYDTFRGLKENVILGRLIPAGTGYGNFSDSGYELNGAIDPEELIRQRQEELEAMQNEMGITAGTIENLNQEAPAKMAPEATS